MRHNRFGNLDEFSTQLQQVRDWTKLLRHLRPPMETSWEKPSDWVLKGANIHGRPVKSLTITLTPTGCQWASEAGGCTMCGEYEGSTKGRAVEPEFHIAQFSLALAKYARKYKPEWVRIYQEGNYVNNDEVEERVQHAMLELASMIEGVQRITIESMAKYIVPEVAKSLRGSVRPEVELEMGMGFEAVDDVVRNVCVNKGESIEDFRKATSVLEDNGIRSLAYVLLKPPFLTERESIEEAVFTLEAVKELGFDAVSLEPLSIHGFTLTHALNLAGNYHVPWLWSILEVVRNAPTIDDFRIGGVGFFPRPTNVAHNRHHSRSYDCNLDFWNAIKFYGQHRDLAALQGLKCSCRQAWEAECDDEPRLELKDRIDEQLSALSLGSYSESIKNGIKTRQPLLDKALPSDGETQYHRLPTE